MRRALMIAMGLWLIGWGYFGLPRRRFTPRPRFDRVEWVPFFEAHPRDLILNLLYYFVFGVIAAKLGKRDSLIVACGAALSAATEFSQLFVLRRHPSATDFIANTAGVVLGVMLVRSLAAWRRGPASARTAHRLPTSLTARD
jgi:hypothetical protein